MAAFRALAPVWVRAVPRPEALTASAVNTARLDPQSTWEPFAHLHRCGQPRPALRPRHRSGGLGFASPTFFADAEPFHGGTAPGDLSNPHHLLTSAFGVVAGSCAWDTPFGPQTS